METLRKFKYILLIAAILLGLMIIRSAGNRAWKGNADEAAEMMASGKYLMEISELPELRGQVTLLRFGDVLSDSLLLSHNLPQLHLAFGDLAGKEKLKELKAAENRLVIVSNTPSEAVKAWIILNQLGVKNLFVLTDRTGDGEALKYQFRPDSSFRPEPVPMEN